MPMQVTWPELWEAVIALSALVGLIVAGGSLYVKMSIHSAISDLIDGLDRRYVRRDEIELITIAVKHLHRKGHGEETD